jgi:hypothetical protein
LVKLGRIDDLAWGGKDFADEKHGVFVHALKDKHDEASKIFWRSAEVSVSLFNPDAKWWHDVSPDPKSPAVYRIRLAPETISYLVTSAEVPADVRLIALREIYRVEGFAQGERLRLIEMASRDPEASIRYTAILKAAEYEPFSGAVPILCRALCDPSIQVSHTACGCVNGYFFPAKDKGEGFVVRKYVGGAVDIARHREVVAVAQKVHNLRPDLVTDEDLATIESLRDSRMPQPMKPVQIWPESRAGIRSEAVPEAKPQEKPDAKSPKPESR